MCDYVQENAIGNLGFRIYWIKLLVREWGAIAIISSKHWPVTANFDSLETGRVITEQCLEAQDVRCIKMDPWIRTIYHNRLNKLFSLTFVKWVDKQRRKNQSNNNRKKNNSPK